MRLFLVVALLPAFVWAAILPDTVGAYKRQEGVAKPAIPGPAELWQELGLKSSETASYQGAGSHFKVFVYQLADSTAALAAYYWQRPAPSKPSKMATLAAETPDSLILVQGNYLLAFQGYKPSKADVAAVLGSLPNVDHTAFPNIYLPAAGLVPNSERYITGLAGLKAFIPGIPTTAAAFHMGAEAQSGVFHSPKGDLILTVFNYPTPQIAMKQLAEFQKAGLPVKRAGPLVSVVLPAAADPDLAQNLLSQIHYQAQITVPEHIPTLRDNIGNLVINAFVLIGILLAITLAAGLFVGGLRAYQRRGGRDPDADTVIGLHLQ